MRVNDKLVLFMKCKARELEKFGIDPQEYFNESDERSIIRWSEDIAEKVWRVIKHNNARGLTNERCPFCIKQEIQTKKHGPGACIDCSYKRNRNVVIM